MLGKKCFDIRQRRYEVFRKLGIRHLSNQDQERNVVPHDRLALVYFVADTLVMGDCYAVILSAIFQPLLIGTFWRKQIAMPLHRYASGSKNGRELLP